MPAGNRSLQRIPHSISNLAEDSRAHGRSQRGGCCPFEENSSPDPIRRMICDHRIHGLLDIQNPKAIRVEILDHAGPTFIILRAVEGQTAIQPRPF
jgi:hypothetical protein